jgi:uncharacterized phiE125 gp8 family phage protein
MGLKLSKAPTVEPISTAEAKDQARIEFVEDDALICAMIEGARLHVEQYLQRTLTDTTYILTLDSFPPEGCAILMPKPPLRSVSSITYVDQNGATQTWASSDYTVDTSSDEVGRVTPVYNGEYPTTRAHINAVTITYVAGYGGSPKDVPASIRASIKLLVAHWYEHREAYNLGKLEEVPEAFKAILNPYRNMVIA